MIRRHFDRGALSGSFSYIKGLDNVMGNLNKAIQRIEGRTLQGLIEAAVYIRRDMDKTSPTIPVDTNNLRASYFTIPSASGGLSGKGPVVMMGFTANYAAFVHEMVGAHFKRPGSGAKFFEAALKRNKQKILSIIQRKAHIK